jgi:dTDP-4-dehydrorhamnose 3,5-epimerase
MPIIEECNEIKDVLIVNPDVHGDERGNFIETYRRSWFPLGREMIQGNRGDRALGSLVGLHYHLHQADYWYVPFGICRIVLHDIRAGSPTQGNTYVTDVGDTSYDGFDHRGIFIPPGVAHGFLAVTNMTITYMVDSYYNKNDELGVLWSDPAIKADWGDGEKIVSSRDMANPLIADIPQALIPTYGLRT